MPSQQLGKSRQSTVTYLSFPTLPSIKLQPVSVDLYEEHGTHDVLVMKLSTAYPTWFKLLKTGVPVKFYYAQGAFSRQWIGYISHVSRQVTGQLREIMEVHCIGSTFALKDRSAQVFQNTTIPAVVKTIVENFGFKFVGEPHSAVFDHISISGVSYWEWIQEQAKKIGYGVVTDGMTFHFKPLDNIIDQGVSSIPVFAMFGKGTGINNMQLDRTLDHFRVLSGEHIESSSQHLRTIKTVSGVHPITGAVVSTTVSPNNVGTATRAYTSDVLFSQTQHDQVAPSPALVRALAEGHAHHSRFNIPARLSGQGDPRIRVLNPVLVVGTTQDTDGIWIVKKVTHHFTSNNNYQVDLEVMSDGLGDASAAYSRKTPNTAVGKVDLTDAINNGGVSSRMSGSFSVQLKTQTPGNTELNQGWNRTPSKWVYSAGSMG